MVHMTVPGGSERAALILVNSTFHGQNLTVQLTEYAVSGKNERVRNRNVNKQNGAMAALSDAAKNHWFEGYDWIIWLNPDVIVRNETFLVNTIYGDPDATALLVDWYHGAHNDNAEHDYLKVHTDFFALKPSALPPNAFLIPKTNNAEKSFTAEIQSTILKVGGHWLIPGAEPLRPGWCKVGYGRVLGGLGDTPIAHYHPPEISDISFLAHNWTRIKCWVKTEKYFLPHCRCDTAPFLLYSSLNMYLSGPKPLIAPLWEYIQSISVPGSLDPSTYFKIAWELYLIFTFFIPLF